MMLMTRFVLVLMIFQWSCVGSEHDNSLKESHRLLNEYTISGNKRLLSQSYEQLILNEEFSSKGLTKENRDHVSTLLMHLQKYDELEALVAESDSVVLEKEVALNLIRSLKVWRTDSLRAYGYIRDNLKGLEQKMVASPGDSLVCIDYFVMRMYLVGRQKTLLELDSFRLTDKMFSAEFHDHILKDLIEEYPQQFLFPREK